MVLIEYIRNPLKKFTCDVLRDVVPFVQFKKREKHPWGSVTFSTKSNTPPWVFFMFFKLCKGYPIAQNITYIMELYDLILTK